MNKYEPSKFLSILKCKCPQCQSGNMFKTGPYNLKGFTKMHETCTICKLKFEIEPGYFWGAMYVSYAFSVAFMVIIGGAILLLSGGNAGFWTYIIPIVSSYILLSPITYRLARVVMLHIFSPIKFNTNYLKKG